MSLSCDANAALTNNTNKLANLSVIQFRNLLNVTVSLKPHLNLITGSNGAGKSSILEATYLLGFGRSFRSRHRKSYITYDHPDVTISAQLHDLKGKTISLGLSKSQEGATQLRLGGEKTSLVQVAKMLPIQLLHPGSFDLLIAGPEVRRQFMDWGVFHVEHFGSSLWQQFQQVLKQRNAALKQCQQSGDEEYVKAWDIDFIALSERLAACREQFYLTFLPVMQEVVSRFLPEIRVEAVYYKGWEGGLPQKLNEGLRRDKVMGFTQAGPQRADLLLTVNGLPAGSVLSRGQQKLVVSALLLAQGYWLHALTGRQPIFLIDDLASELDSRHLAYVLDFLMGIGGQVLLTAIESKSIEKARSCSDVNHICVENGEIVL